MEGKLWVAIAYISNNKQGPVHTVLKNSVNLLWSLNAKLYLKYTIVADTIVPSPNPQYISHLTDIDHYSLLHSVAC